MPSKLGTIRLWRLPPLKMIKMTCRQAPSKNVRTLRRRKSREQVPNKSQKTRRLRRQSREQAWKHQWRDPRDPMKMDKGTSSTSTRGTGRIGKAGQSVAVQKHRHRKLRKEQNLLMALMGMGQQQQQGRNKSHCSHCTGRTLCMGLQWRTKSRCSHCRGRTKSRCGRRFPSFSGFPTDGGKDVPIFPWKESPSKNQDIPSSNLRQMKLMRQSLRFYERDTGVPGQNRGHSHTCGLMCFFVLNHVCVLWITFVEVDVVNCLSHLVVSYAVFNIGKSLHSYTLTFRYVYISGRWWSIQPKPFTKQPRFLHMLLHPEFAVAVQSSLNGCNLVHESYPVSSLGKFPHSVSSHRKHTVSAEPKLLRWWFKEGNADYLEKTAVSMFGSSW